MTSVSTDRRQGVNSSAAIKVPCKVATTAAITLSGEQTIDGVACVTGDRVLVKNQASTAANGIYRVDTGTWSRDLDFDGAYDVKNGCLCYIISGTQSAGAWYIVVCTDPVTIGTTAITFSRQNINNVTLTSVTASAGQTVVNVAPYQPLANSACVFVDGLRARLNADYTETSATQITFTYPLQAGQEVDVYTGLSVGNLTAAAASSIAITDAGDFYVATTVESVLQEIASAITADVGDADATLTYASSATVQRWNTPLNANRTVTLSTSNAKEGATFIVVRGAGCTGDFTLIVGSLATLRAFGEWCQVKYDAGTAAWVLIQWGRLPSAGVPALLSDNGDASATLTVGSSQETQRWATALTADRTASLSATGAWRGARFKVVRDELSTGAFSLIVSGSATLCRLGRGQWAEFQYDGSAWDLLSSGDCRQGETHMVRLFDDFVGMEIDGYLWQGLAGTDPNCDLPVIYADQIGGVVRMTGGADAGATMALNGVQLHSALNWRANNGGMVMEVRICLPVITSINLFVGFTDQNTVLEAPFTMAAGNILTSNASDAVGILFDTDADTDVWWLVGVAADIDAAKQVTAFAPVAGTFTTWRIEVSSSGVATFYRNGTLIGTAMSTAVTTSVPLTPVIAGFSRTNVIRCIDADLISVSQNR